VERNLSHITKQLIETLILQKKDVKIELYKAKKIIEKNKKNGVLSEDMKDKDGNIFIIKDILINQLKCILNQIDELKNFQEELTYSIQNKKMVMNEIMKQNESQDESLSSTMKNNNNNNNTSITSINNSNYYPEYSNDNNNIGKKGKEKADAYNNDNRINKGSTKIKNDDISIRNDVISQKIKQEPKNDRYNKNDKEGVNIIIKTENDSKNDKVYVKLKMEEKGNLEKKTERKLKNFKEKLEKEQDKDRDKNESSNRNKSMEKNTKSLKELKELHQYIKYKEESLNNLKHTYNILHRNKKCRDNDNKDPIYDDDNKNSKIDSKKNNNRVKSKYSRNNSQVSIVSDSATEIRNKNRNIKSKRTHRHHNSSTTSCLSESEVSYPEEERQRQRGNKKKDYKYQMQKTYDEVNRLQDLYCSPKSPTPMPSPDKSREKRAEKEINTSKYTKSKRLNSDEKENIINIRINNRPNGEDKVYIKQENNQDHEPIFISNPNNNTTGILFYRNL